MTSAKQRNGTQANSTAITITTPGSTIPAARSVAEGRARVTEFIRLCLGTDDDTASAKVKAIEFGTTTTGNADVVSALDSVEASGGARLVAVQVARGGLVAEAVDAAKADGAKAHVIREAAMALGYKLDAEGGCRSVELMAASYRRVRDGVEGVAALVGAAKDGVKDFRKAIAEKKPRATDNETLTRAQLIAAKARKQVESRWFFPADGDLTVGDGPVTIRSQLLADRQNFPDLRPRLLQAVVGMLLDEVADDPEANIDDVIAKLQALKAARTPLPPAPPTDVPDVIDQALADDSPLLRDQEPAPPPPAPETASPTKAPPTPAPPRAAVTIDRFIEALGTPGSRGRRPDAVAGTLGLDLDGAQIAALMDAACKVGRAKVTPTGSWQAVRVAP